MSVDPVQVSPNISAGMDARSAENLAFIPAHLPTIAIEGTDKVFPVRRIWCVGRNYRDHALEMGGDPEREPPFFFSKPADAVVPGGGNLPYPSATSDLHHEVELAVAICGRGRELEICDVASLIFGYSVALDMTRRDIQLEAKKLSRPWEMAKGFDQSCPISPIRPVADVGPIGQQTLQIEVNGKIRQRGLLSDMIWTVAECISSLSRFVELQPGDLLLTGTPSGWLPLSVATN